MKNKKAEENIENKKLEKIVLVKRFLKLLA